MRLLIQIAALQTGIIVAGKDADGHGYVLADQSARFAPTEWARTAIALYRQHKADRRTLWSPIHPTA